MSTVCSDSEAATAGCCADCGQFVMRGHRCATSRRRRRGKFVFVVWSSPINVGSLRAVVAGEVTLGVTHG